MKSILLFITLFCFSEIFGQSAPDTLYPGYDLEIVSMEPAKKETIQGEGVVLSIKVNNKGAYRSPAAVINFYLTESDDEQPDSVNLVDQKELIELQSNSHITFNKLIVIPPYYKGKIAYITAEIPLDKTYTYDPTPNNNQKLAGVKLGEMRNYKGGMYSFDTYIKDFKVENYKKKIIRGKEINLTALLGNKDIKPLKPTQTVDIYLSANALYDDSDILLRQFSFPKIRAGESVKWKEKISIDKRFAKGTVYLIAKINNGYLDDPDKSDNISEAVKIKLK
ncbi:MAG TPA: hypothetical protein PK076_08950 [Saprospiraceae bacterium]|nr:hypothetical protein [Saprospiraceae bacterium]